jgi:hypothetical protein
METALSTTLCVLPASSSAVLDRWRELCAGRELALAIDPRIAPPQQAELLQTCLRLGIRCIEIAHPRPASPGLRAPCPVSPDRDERRAAQRQIIDTLRRACSFAVHRVLVRPSRLSLSCPESTLARLFAEDRGLPLQQISEERDALAGPAMDHLCSMLDPILRAAEDLSVSVVLPWPTPWPHQVPSAPEVALLLRTFAGAPLTTCWCSDWAHCGAYLVEPEEDQTPGAPPATLPLGCVRLADACGLSLRLALGCGEIPWNEVLPSLDQRADRVLTFRPDTGAAEMRWALALAEAWSGAPGATPS